MGDHSFLSIESEDFRNMIYNLRKDAVIPSADTIKTDILNTFKDSVKKIRRILQVSKLIINVFYQIFFNNIFNILQGISSKISFTIDAWTSSNFISFLGITAHWISKEWELKSLLLDFVKLEGSHSGKNIKEAFLKSLKDFGITNKVSFFKIFKYFFKKIEKIMKFYFIQILAITTDNASNNITFLQEVSSELIIDDIEFDNKNQHVRCLAHIINLAAQEALKSLKAIPNISINEFLDEGNNNNNEQGQVAGLLHKVNNF